MITAEQITKHLSHQLGEHLDGFVLIGFTRGGNESVMLADVPDVKTAMALNSHLVGLTCGGGVRATGNEPSED